MINKSAFSFIYPCSDKELTMLSTSLYPVHFRSQDHFRSLAHFRSLTRFLSLTRIELSKNFCLKLKNQLLMTSWLPIHNRTCTIETTNKVLLLLSLFQRKTIVQVIINKKDSTKSTLLITPTIKCTVCSGVKSLLWKNSVPPMHTCRFSKTNLYTPVKVSFRM